MEQKTTLENIIKLLNTPIWVAKKNSPRRKQNTAKKNLSAQFSLEGEIEKGFHSSYSINGEDIVISDNTFVIGELKLGSMAKVKGLICNGNEKRVTKIIIEQKQ